MAITDSIAAAFETLTRLTAKTVEHLHSELSFIATEQNRLAGRVEQVNAALAEMGEAAPTLKANVAPAARLAKAAPTKPTTIKPKGEAVASTAMGDKIVAFLQKQPGKFVASSEVAKAIGSPKVSAALAEYPGASQIERKGAGRRMEYRIKA